MVRKRKKKKINFSNPTSQDLDVLEKSFNEYFMFCDQTNSGRNEATKIAKPYTLSGLLYSAGITKDEFIVLLGGKGAGIAKMALLRIESFIEENTLSGRISPQAAINTLKFSPLPDEFDADKKSEGTRELIITMDDELRTLGE